MKITTNNITVEYSVEGSGPTLLFIHGITDRGSLWAPVISHLTSAFTCVTLDLRGHGASSHEKVSVDGFVEDVHSVIEALGGAPVGLVGHSLGGFVATQFAALYPEKVTRVVNIDQVLNFAAIATSFRPLEPALRSPQFPAVLEAIFTSLGATLLPQELQDEMRQYRGISRQETVLAVWDILFKSTDQELTSLTEGILRSIRCPYLALYGSILPEEYHQWLKGLLPGAQIESWEGQGHYLHLLSPERISERLRTFFAS